MLPCGSVVKNLPATKEIWVRSWVGEIPWKRKWQPTPVFLPGKCHGQRSLASYSPWGHRVKHNLVSEHSQMDLEIIILSEASRKEKEKYHNIACMWNLKYDTNELTYKTETDSQTCITGFWLLRRKGLVEGCSGSLGLAYANCYI